MSFAVWIALAVVFIAVLPPILKNARQKREGKDGGSDSGGTSSGDSGCDSDGGGGD